MTAELSPFALAQRADEIEALAFADLFAALPAALQPRLGLQVRRVAGATALLARGLPSSMFNRVIGLGAERPAAEADIDALMAAYQEHGGQPWWLHCSPHAQPQDLPQRLLARGFIAPARRSWAKVMRDNAPAPIIASDLQIEPATGATLADTAAAITQAFGMPPFMPAWIAALHGRPGWTVYTVKDAAMAVGGGCLFMAGDTAWLGMGGLLDSHRRRGGQGALMARRIADAIAAGCRHIATEAGEPIGDEPNPSLANMVRCGFVTVGSRLNFEAPRSP
jgi:hypothetical protein